MWMMGYNEGGEVNLHDSFNGTRKLRPLVPRPLQPSSSPTTNPPPCLARINGSDHFFAQYHHHMGSHHVGSEQNKRELMNGGTPQVVVSSRWNPTPEQLRALEELYRRGTRTPSAEQIQHITAQLRRYGKIEGKNVFYWFQNHKARERQKRRRQMESPPHRDLDNMLDKNNKDLGASRTVSFEVEQTKNWAPSTNCSTTLAEESHVTIQRAAKAAVGSECNRTDGWIQFGEGELQQRRNSFVERNATWQHMMQLSCPPPPPFMTNLINSIPITTATSTSTSTSNTSRTASVMRSTAMVDQRLIKTHDHLGIFITPAAAFRENGNININNNNSQYYLINSSDHNDQLEDICSSTTTNLHADQTSQTLQLFPLRSGRDNERDTEISVFAMNDDRNMITATTPPCQFFEFLPLKN